MRKQLGILASLLLLGVSALLWTGCSSNRCGNDSCEPCEPICNPCKPICSEPRQPTCPQPCPTPCAEPRRPSGPPPRVEQYRPCPPPCEERFRGGPPQHEEQFGGYPPQHEEQFCGCPPQHEEQFGGYPPQHEEQFCGCPPQHEEQFGGYPPQHEEQFGRCPPQHEEQFCGCPPQHEEQFGGYPPQHEEQFGGYPPQHEEQFGGCPPQYEEQFRGCPPPRTEQCRPPCAPQRAEPCRPACPPPCAEPCRPACPPPCAPPRTEQCRPPCTPPAPEVCPPKCAAPLKRCKFGPAGECSCNGVTVRAKNPRMCMLGDQYPLDLEITACCNVCEVLLSTTLPEGVTYMRSQPEAKLEGRVLTWEFGGMSKGQTTPARIWLKCEREGDICTCFCVKATPVAFCALLCAKPVLVCEKCGPEEVGPGEPINYTITVTNIGTCTAEEVLVTDVLPEGVEHSSCQRTLNFKLGNLEPCQTKKVNFSVTPCKRGKICNTAIVSACNANQTSCEVCTCVACCAVECQKVGPKEIPVGQNADYQITVVNTGDKALHEVVVTDTAPTATSIVAAPGANICGKQAVWKLRELKAGERVSFNITLTTCTPGFFTNSVNVTDCEACNSSCEFGTHWKGRPAYDVCIESSDNPICVGETTRFKIVVVNKGQEYDSNVNVVINFPPELVPVTTSGASAAQVSGQTVTFVPFPNIAPRQTLEYYVTVKANGRGDLRPKVQVSSDFIKNPITQEESLIVN